MNIKEKLKELPERPGCYLMKNEDGTVIYVGKAKNLSNRVHSYFVGAHNAKTTRLVKDITDFEFIITSSETEAFILEINLIKKYRPRYNIMLMDDKQYPYICISNEKHPKLYYTRDLNKKGKYFGPYPNAKAAKETVDMLNKIYPLRKCNKIPHKECLYYHLGNCLAPCIKEVKKEEYDVITNKIIKLLKGNVKDEIKDLKIKMQEESDKLNYEKAIEYHNIILNLESVSEKQKMETQITDSDIFNYAIKDDFINIQVFHIRNNKVIERNAFTFDLISEHVDIFLEFLANFYLIKNNPIPREVIIPDVDISSIDDELKNHLIIPKRGKKKELLDLVLVNINKELDNIILKRNRTYEMTEGAAIELAKILGLSDASIIESFDNSNISGVSAVSAMVRYVNGVKSPKDYRKFSVKTINHADDSGTFREVITRRYKRLKQEGGALPNLILMDGGKQQVNACLASLNDLELEIPVCGMVKDDNHRTRALLYNNQEISLDKKSPVFKFLTNIQDEVHRYAISFHHNTHGKQVVSSKLDAIPGIGKVKKTEILKILGEPNFVELLNNLKLSETQIEEVLKLYNPL